MERAKFHRQEIPYRSRLDSVTASQFSESSPSATHRHPPPKSYVFIDLYAQTKSISTKMPIN